MNQTESNRKLPAASCQAIRLSEEEIHEFLEDYRQLLATVRLAVAPEKPSIARVMHRAIEALEVIATSIRNHPHTGQSRRLVKFVAGCYNGTDYPFNLTELRGLDTRLASACIEYLDYDRLAIREIHYYLPNGDRTLHQWLKDYDIRAASDLRE